MTEEIPQTQTAYGYEFGNRDVVRFDNYPVPQPGPTEVLLKVEAAGLCKSDLNILKDQNPGMPPKYVLGHEVAGKIVKIGKDVDDLEYGIGDRFCLYTINACGVCSLCRQGKEQCCPSKVGYGIGKDGGFQQYLLVSNLATLIRIPDGVSYAEASAATDAVLAPYHAIHKVKEFLTPTSNVLMFGLGGLGINALQILRQYGCRVVACDVKPELEEEAKRFGATEYHTNIEDSENDLESFDVCFDFCGFKTTFDLCQRYVAANGKIVLVGMGEGKLNIVNYHLARREVQVFFNIGGNAYEQLECLKWIQQGRIKPVVTVHEFDQIPKAFKDLAAGKIKGRVAFRPSKL